jgi:CHAT domain-containing protein/Tfp pilus assembly protein PilF
VVSSCEPGGAAAVAGLLAGDVILEWHQGSANGDAASPYHLAMVEQELAPHGPVVLTVRRGRVCSQVSIPIGLWKTTLHPALEPEETAALLRARELVGSGDADGSLELWSSLANSRDIHDDPLTAAWLRMQTGVALARSGRRDDAIAALENAAELIALHPLLAAHWERAGDALLFAGQTDLAADAFESAITIHEDESPSSPALAHALLQLCRTDYRAHGDRADRALEIYRETREGTIESAVALAVTANVAYLRSELDTAERGFLGALAITHDQAPGSSIEATLLGCLGLVARKRGDFDAARDYLMRDKAAAEKFGVESLEYAFACNFLGLLAKSMGRLDEARLHFEQSLASFRAARPGGFEVAGVLTNLGNLAESSNNLRQARHYLEDALRLRRRLDPESTSVASSLHNLGLVCRRQGDLETARRLLDEAFELKQRLHPGSLWIATTLFELGELARVEGAFDRAADHHRAALEIRRRIAPEHPDVAASLLHLGIAEKGCGRPRVAENLWTEAVALIEAKRRRLSISEEHRARFRAKFGSCYFHLAGLLIEQGRRAEAWNLLEQARAGALWAAVAYRGSTPAGVPPEMWHAKTRAETRLARIESRIFRLDPARENAQIARYRAQAASVEAELDAILKAIREAAPALRELESIPALSFAELRGALHPGTAVLVYAVGTKHAVALVTSAASDGRPEIQTFTIAVAANDLRDRVDRFNSLLARGRSVTEIEAAVTTQAQLLFDHLVAPAWGTLRGAERVLIVPDGPLHDLAFAALRLPGDEDRYLGQVKPLFVSPSASLAVELRSMSGGRPADPKTVVAFGDPAYPTASTAVREHRLDPLPGSRTEIDSIGRIFGRRAGVFFGQAASEASFKARASDAGILHCAVHTRVDPFEAMDSALFFTQPIDPDNSAEDGILSAWEIVEELDLDDATVVLSSCSSARGRVVPGEGIIGLARAFQIAGARTLVASQWEVPDHSTATLMSAFYQHLANGRSTVEALQLARQTVAADPDLAHPFHWASFQVRGDWR